MSSRSRPTYWKRKEDSLVILSSGHSRKCLGQSGCDYCSGYQRKGIVVVKDKMNRYELLEYSDSWCCDDTTLFVRVSEEEAFKYDIKT